MAKNCYISQTDLDWCEGLAAYAGVYRTVYYIAKSDIVGVTYPDRTHPQYQLEEGRYFKRLVCDSTKSTASSKTQGSYPSKTMLDTLTLSFPKATSQYSNLAKHCHNRDNVYFFKTAAGGWMSIGGSDAFITKSQVAQDFGQPGSSGPTTTLTVEAHSTSGFEVVRPGTKLPVASKTFIVLNEKEEEEVRE